MSKVDAPSGVEAGTALRGALPVGTRLRDYQLISVLGQGAFGITYRAHDTILDRDVAIKEYLPVSLAVREKGTTVVARSTALEGEFVWGRDRFLDEARTLAKLDRAPAVVRVHDFLEANGTAYMITALVEGETLGERMLRGHRLDRETIERVLDRLLDGLEEIHGAGFLHRDIKPANIILDAMNNPTLIDFGAARTAMAARTATLTAVFTPGYAAPEQFTISRQGPWTDIYGLSATLYYAITGKAPPTAFDRLQDDAYEALDRLRPSGFSQSLLSGIDAGLAVRVSHRPQSIAEWRGLLRRQRCASSNNEATVVIGRPQIASPQMASMVVPIRADGIAASTYTDAGKPPKRLAQPRHGHRALKMALATALVAILVGAYLNRSLLPVDAIRAAIVGEPLPAPASGDRSAEANMAEATKARLNLTMADRRRIQVALTHLGFDTHGSDGRFGQRSREMIVAWQKAHNRPSTGFLDDAQWQMLLKEAASATSRRSTPRKSADEERELQGTTQPDVLAPPPNPPAATMAIPRPPSNTTAAVIAFDGSYAGSFFVYPATSWAAVVARVGIKVSLGHGAGSVVFEGSPGSGGGTISIDISPAGRITGEGVATEPNGVRNRFAIGGHAEDKRLELELKGLGKDSFSMTLHRTSQER